MVINRFDIRKALSLAVFMVFLVVSICYGQTAPADTLQLEEIEVVATRIHQPLVYQPTSVGIVDSARLSMLSGQDIGQVLASQTTLFIKDNGPGGLANASQRGLSSEQIQILWEGIPINNVMLGQKDLSLLPAGMFSSAQISSGTPSTAFGGGSLAGALYLSSDWEGANQLSLQQSVGSFGQWHSSLKAHYRADGWRVSVRSSVDRAENDFQYYNRAYDRQEHRSHNRQEQENVMASIGRNTAGGSWESTIWFSDSDNQIPGTILTGNPRGRQKDQALRWLSSYETHIGSSRLSIKNYFDRVELNYFDPANETRSLSTTRRWMARASLNNAVSKHLLLKGELSGGITGVETNNYTSGKIRRQLSLLANPELVLGEYRLRIYPAIRLDSYNDFGTVLSPSLGFNYALVTDWLYLRGQLSRDFNPPAFNALYWGEGGNPDLKPERSKSAEAGLTLTPNTATFSSVRLTAFYTRVNNGIRWSPNDIGRYTPRNIEQITSRGLEVRLENQLSPAPEVQLQLQQSATFTDAAITEPRFPGDAAVGQQMRYVPKWKYQASLSLQKGMVRGLLQYRWIGRRYYTATANLSSSLDPYQVLDATVQLQQKVEPFTFRARAGVHNLLDTNYEVIQWYPMPQRNYTFSLTATYQF